MKSRDFCFWLQGLFEIANPQELTVAQTTMIKNHLKLVFKHEIDPSMPDPTGEMQTIHDIGVAHNPEALKGAKKPPHFLDDAGGSVIMRC